MGLKRLEVFLVSEEEQKINGANPRGHSGLGIKSVFHRASFWGTHVLHKQNWGKNKQRRKLLFHFTLSLSV